MMARTRVLVACVVGALFASGCTDNGTSSAASDTMITVEPESFLGAVACAPGEVRGYVATLTDVSPGINLGTSIVSNVTPCVLPVGFAEPPLVLGDAYVGRIDGYDVDDVVVKGGPLPAGSTVVATRASTGLSIAPRWTTTCGVVPQTVSDAAADGGGPLSGFAPTQVFENVNIDMGGCLRFVLDQDAGADGALEDASPEASQEAAEADAQASATAESDAGAVANDLDAGQGAD